MKDREEKLNSFLKFNKKRLNAPKKYDFDRYLEDNEWTDNKEFIKGDMNLSFQENL